VPCPGSFARRERTLVTLWIAARVNARTNPVNLADDDDDDDDDDNYNKPFIMGNNITCTI
jgi:hypothetical protein